MMFYLALAGGLALLLAGGDLLVRGSVSLARRLGVSPLLIGLILVGFGTSMPELVTSLQAARVGSPGIAVGNVVGSNSANILLILGLAALISPVAVSKEAIRRDVAMALLAALACCGVVLAGRLDRWAGALLVLALLGYVIFTYRREASSRSASADLHRAEAAIAEPMPSSTALSLTFVSGGLACTILGARLLVSSSIRLAEAAGVSETVVGLTIVSLGTSLPELVTSLIASSRRQGDIAFGNVVGSNIFNVLGILGVTAIVQPIPVPGEIARFDTWVMLAATVLMTICCVTGWRLSRTEGGIFVLLYLAYVAYLAA